MHFGRWTESPVLSLCLQQQVAFQLDVLDFPALSRPMGQALPPAGYRHWAGLLAIQEEPVESAAEQPLAQPYEPAFQSLAQPAQELHSATMALEGGESTTRAQVM